MLRSAFSPDGEPLASAVPTVPRGRGPGHRKPSALSSLITSAESGPRDGVTAVAFSRDGEPLATAVPTDCVALEPGHGSPSAPPSRLYRQRRTA